MRVIFQNTHSVDPTEKKRIYLARLDDVDATNLENGTYPIWDAVEEKFMFTRFFDGDIDGGTF